MSKYEDTSFLFKGELRSLGEEIQSQIFIEMYKINEVITQTEEYFHKWINKLVPEENEVPKTLFEARQVAGSATGKQWKAAWNRAVL